MAVGRLADLVEGVEDLGDTVDDLGGPVGEITTFDQCLYTVGVRRRDGYRFTERAGATSTRPAWAFDLGSSRLPAYDVLAFPGEEPPQIECNEDAAGEGTDE